MTTYIKDLFNGVSNVKADWNQDWKEDSKQDWVRDWTSDFVTAGTAVAGTNTGNGTASAVTVGRKAVAETWTITATTATNFTVSGSVSGAQAALTAGTAYDNGFIGLTITAGGVAFVAGDKFTIAVTANAPENTVAPAITGTTTNGSTLTCSTGTWTGAATIAYSYQWLRGSTVVAGATASTYLTTAADVGSAMSCVVTAKNSAGVNKAAAPATVAIT